MPSARLDHLVIVAASLEQGIAWCEGHFGVAPSGGGAHARMGTHNCLLYLGPDLYLEIIAINPKADNPEIARWFGMDDITARERVATAPELRTFMVAVDDIGSASAALPQLGAVEQMRRGDLQWQITVRPDGAMQEEGCLPGLIQWPQGVHPSASLPDSGCRLVCLEVHHPEPARLEMQWHALGLQQNEQLVIRAAPVSKLIAHLLTPKGAIAISGT